MPPTKVRIEKIESQRVRQHTFLKRKGGLLKKAMELTILCDCDVSIIINKKQASSNARSARLVAYSNRDLREMISECWDDLEKVVQVTNALYPKSARGDDDDSKAAGGALGDGDVDDDDEDFMGEEVAPKSAHRNARSCTSRPGGGAQAQVALDALPIDAGIAVKRQRTPNMDSGSGSGSGSTRNSSPSSIPDSSKASRFEGASSGEGHMPAGVMQQMQQQQQQQQLLAHHQRMQQQQQQQQQYLFPAQHAVAAAPPRRHQQSRSEQPWLNNRPWEPASEVSRPLRDHMASPSSVASSGRGPMSPDTRVGIIYAPFAAHQQHHPQAYDARGDPMVGSSPGYGGGGGATPPVRTGVRTELC